MRPYSYRILSFLICILAGCIPGHAQEKPLTFRIVSFRENQRDLSATDPRYEKTDGDGMRYAIIKIKSENPGDDVFQYDFNFFNMRHEKHEVEGELWLYVQRNAKNVTVTRPGYVPVSQYALSPTIEAGKNYEMVLSAEAKKVYKQPVRFDVTPADARATVMVQRPGGKEEHFGVTGEDGSVAKNLECGKYTYKVTANGYETAEGLIDLPFAGPGPIGPTVTEKVTLVPNMAEVSFEVDADAHIYIDGEQRGIRRFTEKLEVGHQYEVECRQEGCRPTTQTITIRDANPLSITLKAPVQITGHVSVTSSPLDAEVTVAGKSYGLTPTHFELPVGSYAMTLSKPGYLPYNTNFDVTDGQTVEITGTLTSGKKEETAKAEKPEKQPKVKNEPVKNEPSSTDPYSRNMEFYAGVGARIGSGMGAGISLGARIRNINVEFGYSLGLTKGNDVLWATNTTQETYVGKCAYSVDEIEFKAGYQIGLGKKMSLTPQVGYLGQKLAGGDWGNGAMCHNLSVGANLVYKFSPSFGIFANPSYAVPVMVNDLYKSINDYGGPAKGGFNARLGFELSFGK